MRFAITHLTRYTYATPASESFMDVRLVPPTTRAQTVLRHTLAVTPDCRVTTHTDYFGNIVGQFSVIHRHDKLVVRAESQVETHPVAVPPAALDLTISEARQIYRSQPLRLYDALHASPAVELTRQVYDLARRFFRPGDNLGDDLPRLMHWVHERFTYAPGTTHLGTTVAQALAQRRGVCQDYAHVMIAILRAAAIPARYVCGYIETEKQRRAARRGGRKSAGSAESHAWVEVALPNGDWYPLDPTNDIPAGERHVLVAVGRDFHDTSPTRGVFKGAGRTSLAASVVMRRF